MSFSNNKLVNSTGWKSSEDFLCTERKWYKNAEKIEDIAYTTPYVDAYSQQLVIEWDISIDEILNYIKKDKVRSKRICFFNR